VRPKLIGRSIGACAAAILLAACASSSTGASGGGTAAPSGTITYGVLSCFTGRLASLGQAMAQGAKVAQSEINSAGGVLGHKVALVTGDTSCDVADGVTATNQMLTKNVSGVIGPETQEINGVEPILDAQHIVDEFQGGDTARDHQKDPYFFRDSPSDSQLGVAMALYAHNKGYKRAVMLFYSDPAAQTFLKPVSQTFTKLGGTILKTIIVTPDQTSYLSQVRAAIAVHPQVIFTQEDPPTAAVLFREFKQLGGGSIPWVGTDVTSGSDYLKAIGYPTAHATLTSVYGTSVTGTASSDFLSLFTEVGGPAGQRELRLRRGHLARAGGHLREDHQRHHRRPRHDQGDEPARHRVLHLRVVPASAEVRHEDQLPGGQREPRLQQLQQHVRPVRRLPVHAGRRGEAGHSDDGEPAGGGDALAGRRPGPRPAAAARAARKDAITVIPGGGGPGLVQADGR
jgi:ABC-type branched-subunit amino acid transport system substrate-binding protein